MSLQLVYRFLLAAINVLPWGSFLQIVSAVQWQEILGRDSTLTGAQKKAAVVTVITSQWPAAARYAGLLNDLAWLWCVLKGLIHRAPEGNADFGMRSAESGSAPADNIPPFKPSDPA